MCGNEFSSGSRPRGAWLARVVVTLGCLWQAGVCVPLRAAESAATAAKPTVSAGSPAAVLDESPILVDQVVPRPGASGKAVLEFPAADEQATPTLAVVEYPSGLTKDLKAPDEPVEVKMSLDATPLAEVVPFFAALLKFGYLLDPAVKGAVTVTVDETMSARDVWAMFEEILALSGAYASRNPGYIHVLPRSQMQRDGRLLAQQEPAANVQVSLLPIMHVQSAEIAAGLKPFLSDGAGVTDVPGSNSLLIVETPANMPRVRELISRLDSRGEAAWPHRCLPCNVVPADALVEELNRVLPVVGLQTTDKSPSGGQVKLTALPRLGVVVASAPLSETLAEVERWCRALDRNDPAQQESIYFYNARHTPAPQLGQVLEVFLNARSTRSSTGAVAKAAAPAPQAPAAGEASIAYETPRGPETALTRSESRAQSLFQTPVVVYVDEGNNRLTVRTTPPVFALVRALLERHDVPKP